MRYIYIKLKVKIDGHPVGQKLRLQVDKRGLAIQSFWRKRIKDSATDKCLIILKKEPKKGFLNG